MFKQAKWIWLPTETPDTHADFICDFDYTEGNVSLSIAADSNYAVYLNGELAAFGQYADYPWFKVGDTVDITAFAKPGANRLAVIVWYCGVEGFSTYVKGKAGVIFEVVCGDTILAASSEGTLSRLDPGYVQGACDSISPQLGFTYRRLETRADDTFLTGGKEHFAPSAAVDITTDIRPRPNKKLVLGERQEATICRAGVFTYAEGWENDRPSNYMQSAAISMRWLHAVSDRSDRHVLTGDAPITVKSDGNTVLILDLGHESVGFLDIDIDVPHDCQIDIGWGEHLDDGVCRTSIRGFFTQLYAKAGRNTYMNPFRRLGCRYIQLFIHASTFTLRYAGIRPTDYPFAYKEYKSGNLLRDTIYRVCQDTLAKCYHEHYEDCPWREQALYALDSRNQMLCGYYAFGETEAPRAALRLMAEGLRDNGLLTICYPCMIDLYIPSFSTVYFIQMNEYIKYTGDKTLAAEVFDVMERIMHTFTSRIDETGVVASFPEQSGQFWNFYEWQPTLSGFSHKNDEKPFFEAPLSAFVSLALASFAEICDALGRSDRAAELRAQRDGLNAAIRANFWDDARGLFRTAEGVGQFSVLTNSLCLLCGAADGIDTAELLRILACNGAGTDAIPNTLSMNCFRFDALLAADREKYRDVILDEIDRDYLYMLRNGATTFWETIKGQDDFSGAGSLCHGWSALPLYYYEILN
ncbi:MAG: hypothetical protein E7632_05300 [Ruminococcaceae bacterium]|nr:hypothetical protein [Oscillospiraceae bacterium]